KHIPLPISHRVHFLDNRYGWPGKKRRCEFARVKEEILERVSRTKYLTATPTPTGSTRDDLPPMAPNPNWRWLAQNNPWPQWTKCAGRQPCTALHKAETGKQDRRLSFDMSSPALPDWRYPRRSTLLSSPRCRCSAQCSLGQGTVVLLASSFFALGV